MATRKATPTPTLSFDDNALIGSLLDSADSYVSSVKQSLRGAVTDRIGFTIDAHDKYRPLFDVAVAENRSVNGTDAKYSVSDFCTRMTERGKVLRTSDYVFPIATRDMGVILNWQGSAEDHEDIQDAYDAWCGKQGREMSWGGYVTYLKGWFDPDGNQYTSDGERSARGLQLDKDAEQVADATADQQWCSMNFALNLQGMAPALQTAWIDAALHDLKALRARVAKDAKVKSDAAKLLKSNVGAGMPIGGDRITTAIANAKVNADATATA